MYCTIQCIIVLDTVVDVTNYLGGGGRSQAPTVIRGTVLQNLCVCRCVEKMNRNQSFVILFEVDLDLR